MGLNLFEILYETENDIFKKRTTGRLFGVFRVFVSFL